MGTILPYVGDIKDIPSKWALCDGSNGTPNLLNGRFLEGNTTVGIFKEAGLPNITGQIWFHGNPMYYWSSGSLYAVGKGENTTPTTSPGPAYTCLMLDASKSSPIYGSSTTVQPSSYTVYYIVKIKK